jgi:uncharacterized protein YjiS (DUF1127 family)
MQFFQNLREWQNRSQAIRQLRRLPPEILNDIGIEPGTEEQAVRGLVARRDAAAKAVSDAGDALIHIPFPPFSPSTRSSGAR